MQQNINFEFWIAIDKNSSFVIIDADYLDLKYVRSSTNFVFFESQQHIDKLSAEMLKKGVRIGRPFPPFYDWCRISTGTSEEVNKFINSMLEIYS